MITLTKVAEYGLTILFSSTILFHVLVLIGIIPLDMVWGGRLSNHAEMYVLESVSIVLNFLFLSIILVRIKIIKMRVHRYFFPVTFWLMSAMFLLNTIGNLASVNRLEMLIFTPVTLMLCVFSAVLAWRKQ